MQLREVREELTRYARRLEEDGLAQGTAGNLSVRVGRLVAITPSSLPYCELDASSIAVVTDEGEQVDGPYPPSSELPMHLAAYEATPAGAVVHTHSPYATAVATALDALPCIHYLCADLGGRISSVPYETFGSERLARRVGAALCGRNAALLECHGAVAIGEDLPSAFANARLLEWLAALYYRSRSLGEPATLSDEEIQHVAARLRQTRWEAARRTLSIDAVTGSRGGT